MRADSELATLDASNPLNQYDNDIFENFDAGDDRPPVVEPQTAGGDGQLEPPVSGTSSPTRSAVDVSGRTPRWSWWSNGIPTDLGISA